MPRWISDIMQYIADFSNVLNVSISASWLILAVLLLRPALKRTPKWVNVVLWGIVALRLLMPFSIESVFSLIPSTETVSGQLLQAGPVPGANPAYLEIVTNPHFGSGVTVELDTSISSFQIDLMFMTFHWLVGVSVMLLYAVISYLSLGRRLRTAVILRDNIYRCDHIPSPFVLGLIRPKIYLPCSMNGENIPHVIAHEQAHIQRRDHWWKPLGYLLLSIHWFNPLMWVAYWFLCRDIELACDEKVIARLANEERADYSQALVACSINRRRITACPLAFGEVGVKERVKNVMNYRRPAFWIMVAAVVVCVAVAVCFLTNPPVRALEELPDIRFRKYGVVDLLYDSPWYSFTVVPQENSPEFIVTEQMDLLTRGEMENGEQWTNVGPLEEISLTREIFDQLFLSEDGWIKESPSYIRRNTAKAWRVIYDQERMYYLLQWKNGELYLAYGYYDHSEKDDPGSDDTSFRWLFCLAPEEGGDYVLRARILEIETRHFLVEPVDGISQHDLIQVPMKNMEPSPEPQVGDIIEIEYDGLIQEIYPPILPGVSRIRVLERDMPVDMVPTSADLDGIFGPYLYLTIDGAKYRYERQEAIQDGVQAGVRFATVQEHTGINDVYDYTVYEVKGGTDHSRMLVHSSDMDMMWLYQYSPAKAAAPNALQEAKDSGCVVMENGNVTWGQEHWREFYEDTQQGRAACVRIAQYYTLNPSDCSDQYYEAYREDYPSISIYELVYDGVQYSICDPATGTTRNYACLMHYSDWDLPGDYAALKGLFDRYVLTNDDTVTWAELFAGLVSSQAGAYIDHFTVYVERRDEIIRIERYDYESLFESVADGDQNAEAILRENSMVALAYCMEQFDQGILEGLTLNSTGKEMCMYQFWCSHTRLPLENILESPQQDWRDWSEYVTRMYDRNGYEKTVLENDILDESMVCEKLYAEMLHDR